MKLLLILACVFTVSAMSLDFNLSDIRRLSQSQLNEIYSNAPTGNVPTTDTRGRAVFFPGTFLAAPASVLMGLVWQGKVFSNDGTILLNKVFGFKAIKARVYRGTSWFDNREAIIIDYRGTSLVMGWVRDEIREVSPGVYLGRAYARTPLGPAFVLNFALDAR